MEYNATVSGFGCKWENIYITPAGNHIMLSPSGTVISAKHEQVTYDRALESFTVEAYITVKAVSGKAAVDRVKADLDNLDYLKVNARYL